MKESFSDHIHNFSYKGLRGRYWSAPAYKKEYNRHLIVMLYGNHASLERNQGALQYLRRYGRVLIFDLPGFGGMDSFYKIKKKPNADNYAHFLNAFLKKKVPAGEKFTLVAMSWGFIVMTRCLVLYPDWCKRISSFISFVGFLNCRSLKFSRPRYLYYLYFSRLLKNKVGAFFLRYFVLNGFFLRLFYARTKLAKDKFVGLDAATKREHLDIEVHLWHCNDVQTWVYNCYLILTLNLTQDKVPIDLHHVHADLDQYLDNKKNLEDLEAVYQRVIGYKVEIPQHAPTVIADEEEFSQFVHKDLVTLLEKEARK